MDRTLLYRQMAPLLEAELACGETLIDRLFSEREALTIGDIARIQNEAAAKSEQVERLEDLERQRVSLVQEAGFDPTDPSHMEACLKSCDPPGHLLATWSSVLGHMDRCQKENRINGAIIELSRRYAERALHVLRGSSPDPDVYQASGSLESRKGGRALGKA